MKFASNRSVASVQPCLGVVHDGRPRDNIANAVRGHVKQFDVDGHLCDGKAAAQRLDIELADNPVLHGDDVDKPVCRDVPENLVALLKKPERGLQFVEGADVLVVTDIGPEGIFA
jgi:hypothetical protein